MRPSDFADADARSALDVVARQVRHQTRLVDDLLDVSRVSRGRIALERHDVDLRQTVERAASILRPRAEQAGLELTLLTGTNPLILRGDPTRLEQVVSNLLTNAIKYTPVGGHVRISTRSDDGHAILSVTDDGIGIEQDALERIFDLFAQEDTSIDRSAGGLGIGLTLVRRLVELHGGLVEAHSAGRGQGSEMIVRLPLVGTGLAREESEPPAGPVQPSASRLRILIVEDNEDARFLTRRMLERWGHEVEVAADGESGVRAALAAPPDVALVDIGLPSIDGFEVARRIRKDPTGRNTRLVAVTGYTQPEDERKARAAGFDQLLPKPVDPQRLARLLDGLRS